MDVAVDVDRARRYAHFFFFRAPIPAPGVVEPSRFVVAHGSTLSSVDSPRTYWRAMGAVSTMT